MSSKLSYLKLKFLIIYCILIIKYFKYKQNKLYNLNLKILIAL